MSTTGTTHHPVTSDVGDTTWVSDPLAPPGGGAWDFLIVGGGTAGLVAAHTAAGFGASTLLVERARTGGDCLWTGCVPSKALLAAAHVVGEARAASALGVHVGDITVDFDEVMAHVRSTITAIEPVDSPAALRAAGAKVAQGSVLFTGPQSATVDGTPITFTQALVATGSEPLVPGLPGLADVDPLTSDNVWALTELPERLLVLGGGPIGCELGQAFSRLGSSVTIVEAADRLISGETPPASDAILRSLEIDGIDVRTGVKLISIEPDRAGGPVALLDDGSEVPFDRILVSVGRRPRTSDLGLGAAGVALQQSGHVDVDDRLRTSNPRIWAAGDLTGHAPFTHTAGSHGSLAASNAVLGLRRTVQPDLVPRVTYTSPEVASFGIAADSRPGLRVHTVPHSEVDRARAEGQVHGYSQLVLDAKGKVVGASIVGPRAGESLAEALLAGQQGLKARAVAGAMHAYPTWSDGVWKAALAQGRADLESTPVKQVTAGLATVRRAWLRRRTHTA